MITLDLASLRRFTSHRETRFLLDVAFGDLEPDEDELRDRAGAVTDSRPSGERKVAAEQWVRTPAGWSGVLTGVDGLADAEEWLAAFVAGYPRLGGRVLGGPRSRMWRGRDPFPALTTQLYLTTSDLRQVPSDARGGFWGVDATTTRYVADRLVRWTHVTRGVEHLVRAADWYVETRGREHARSVAEAVERYSSVRLRSGSSVPPRCRESALHPQGLVVAQVQQPALDWRERLSEVRELLTWRPPRSDYGYVRHGVGGIVSGGDGLSWPHVTQAVVRRHRPLLASFVPDAFGVQLLTEAHLQRARDLSAWEVTPLAENRYLVAAKDLEPWFRPVDGRDERGFHVADPQPDSLELVRQARADFGDMILTYASIEANTWESDDPQCRS